MSIYKNSIHAFIKVIKHSPNLITHQDRVELHQIADNLSEDTEEISEIIEDWLQSDSRQQVLQAYEGQLEAIDSLSPLDLNVNLGIGNTKSPTKSNQPSTSSRELLDNAIKENLPLSNSSAPNQQP